MLGLPNFFSNGFMVRSYFNKRLFINACDWIYRNRSCYNQPRVSRPKFRLKTNSTVTVVWLYADGVGLILPDSLHKHVY